MKPFLAAIGTDAYYADFEGAQPWSTSALQWKRTRLTPGSASSKASYVLARLREDILATRFKPTEKLYLKVLTARYDTSVAPVREALAVLAGAGLVILESQKGFRVAPASRDDFVDIAKARKLVEVSALQMSIANGSDEWAQRIPRVYQNLSDLLPRAGTVGPISDPWEFHHREFHFCLIADCGSPTLLNFWSQIHDRFDRYRRLALPSSAYMAGTSDEHSDIMEAVLMRDAKRAAALIGDHIQSITDIVLGQYV